MNRTIHLSLLTLTMLLLNLSFSLGQGCENTDFEYGDFTNWQTFTGYCCGMPINTPGVVTGRHTIITSSYPDQNTNGVIMSMPPIGGGTYTVRLGNSMVGSEAEKLIRQFTVTPQNQLFTYQYALVLEDPAGHSPNDKPKFEVKVFDQNNNIINPPQCGYYQVTAGPETSTSDWGAAGTVRYKDWSTVGVDLSQYMGQQITIQFTVQDCGLGGHFGYAYLDASCGYLDIEVIGFCEGSDTVTLVAPNGFDSYIWPHSGETTQTVQIPTPDPGDSVEVLVTNQSGCETTVLKVFEEYPLPVVTAGNDTTICAGQTIPLWSDGNLAVANYTWYVNGTAISTEQNIDVTPLETTDYTVIVSNKNGCFGGDSAATVHVDVYNDLVFELIDSIYVCNGDNYTVSSPISNPNYNWSFGGTTVSFDSSFIYMPTGSGYLTLTIGDSLCTYQDSIKIVAQNDSPIYDTIISPICSYTTTTVLDAPNGHSNYMWSNGQTGTSISVPANDGDEYIVTFDTPAGCTDSMYFVLQLQTNPTPTVLSPDTMACLGQYSIFSSTVSPFGSDVQWFNLQNGDIHFGATVGFTINQNTTLVVQAFSSGGCTDPNLNDTMNITVDSSAYFAFPPDYTICGYNSDTIFGPANMDSYTWFTAGQIISANTFVLSDSSYEHFYYLTVEKGNCNYTDQIYIDHYIEQSVTEVKYTCNTNNSLTMVAPSGYTSVYWVNFNNSASSNTASPIAHGDEYYIHATTNDGCVDTFTYVINLVTPSVLQPFNDTTICHDGTGQFTAISSYSYDTYSWSSTPNGFLSNNQSISVSPGTTTSYTVNMTNPYNCVAQPSSQSVTLTVDTTYVIPDQLDATVCPWDPVTVSLAGFQGTKSYEFNGQFFYGNQITIYPTQSGILNITTTKGICSDNATKVINVLPSDNYSINSNSILYCEGIDVDLSISPSIYTSLEWYNNGNFIGTTNPLPFNYSGNALITAAMTNSSGCADTATRLFQFADQPKVNLGPDLAPCNAEFVNLKIIGSPDIQSYDWSTFETTPSILVTTTGYYGVKVTNSSGCENSDTVYVDLDSPSFFKDIPNVFTPNGDNVNEVLELDFKNMSDFHLQIFNRWGHLLFETTDPYNFWDGDTKGKPSNDGVYFYKVRYQLNCEDFMTEKQGFVTVER